NLVRAVRLVLGESEPDRGSQEDFAVVERNRSAQRTSDRFRKGADAGGFALGQQNQRELVARKPCERVLWLEQSRQAARDREQDGITHGDTNGVIYLFKAIEIDHNDRRSNLWIGARKAKGCLHAVNKELAVRQTGEIVVDCVEEQTFF